MITDDPHDSTDPSPEQIAATCLEIQATWDDETRQLRLVGYKKTLSQQAKFEGEQLVRDLAFRRFLSRTLSQQLYTITAR